MQERFLAELYLPRGEGDGVAALASSAEAAALAMRGEGTGVRYLRSIFVPEDETCFLLYEGPSAEAVGEAGRRAGLEFERVVMSEEFGGA